MNETDLELEGFDASLSLKNPRQEAFAREYIKDLRKRAAALRAGYNEAGAHVVGYRLVRDSKVWARIEYLIEERAKTIGIDKHWVLKNLMEVYNRCMEGKRVMVYDPIEKCMVQETREITDPETGDVHEVGVWQFDSRGANSAMEMIGKHIGMFNTKIDLNHNIQEIKWSVGPSPFMQPTGPGESRERIANRKLLQIKQEGKKLNKK